MIGLGADTGGTRPRHPHLPPLLSSVYKGEYLPAVPGNAGGSGADAKGTGVGVTRPPNGAGGRADTGATRPPDCVGGERGGGCGRRTDKARGGGGGAIRGGG